MRLLDLYVSFKNGDIDEDAFALALDMSASSLRHRMTLWGPRLPTLFSVLDGIADGSLTRIKAGEHLGVTLRQVNKLMESWAVRRPIALYSAEREVTRVKRLMQHNAALDYIAGRRDLKKASDDAHLSDRQMRRWVSQLLNKYHQMTWGEFHDGLEQRASEEQRKKFKHRETDQEWREGLARAIRRAEDIEGAREDLARALSKGKLTVQQVAADRIVERRLGVA